MTLEEFERGVLEMRAAQRKYFRTRSSASLSEARELEKIIDGIIARDIPQEKDAAEDSRQLPLFGE